MLEWVDTNRKVTDQMIKDYCIQMNYNLVWIGEISSFVYERKGGDKHQLLKAAAGPKNLDNWVYDADLNKYIRRYEPRLRKNRR